MIAKNDGTKREALTSYAIGILVLVEQKIWKIYGRAKIIMKWQKCVLLLTLLLFIAGCGTGADAAASAPTSMTVTRSSTIPNHLPPFSRMITDVAAVQKLYGAAQSLPKAGVHNWMCPLDSGVVYHVRFLEGKTVLQQWDMDAIGCYAILLHKDDPRQPNQVFVSLFAQTIGLAKLH
jgi:hypothetical protein